MDAVELESAAESVSEQRLPLLREELQIIPGAPLMGGAPSWMIYDPVQSKFYQVSIEVFNLLSHWSAGTTSVLIETCQRRLGRVVEEQEVLDATRFLTANSLTRDSASGSYQDYAEQKQRSRQSLLSWMAHHYLFFRIPLVKPSRLLQRSLPLVDGLFSPITGFLIALISVFALLLVSRQWEVFTGQFSHLFNVTGLAVYFLCLLLVKVIHELGHAYTATRYGVRVSSMGIAFLVMFPVLYTDTTDAWRLRSSAQRAWIDAAGMIVELAVAGLATFLWLFLEDGPIRSAVFALATTGWVLSLLVNLNPFMRFDGYYLLADSLGMPNLQPRSFALSKWWLREFLFGLNEPAPEPNHTRRRAMIIYGFSVWVYRFFLFLGIALLVYALFFKVLGVVLFALEIAWFIVLPMVSEMKVWWKKREVIRETRRAKCSLGVVFLFSLLVFVPWSSTVQVPAVLAAKQVTTIYSKHDAIVESIAVHAGQLVDENQTLLQLRSPELEFELQVSGQEIALIRARQSRRMADELDRSNSIVLKQQLDMALVRQAGIKKKLQELRLDASFPGLVTDLDRELHEGQWINQKMPLGTLVDGSVARVRGYIGESILVRVSEGQEGTFVPDNITVASRPVRLTMIASADNEAIDIPYLASVYGGDIAVQQDEGALVSIESAYLVEFELDELGVTVGQVLPGIVRLEAQRQSFATRLWRAVAKVTVRELGV